MNITQRKNITRCALRGGLVAAPQRVVYLDHCVVNARYTVTEGLARKIRDEDKERRRERSTA